MINTRKLLRDLIALPSVNPAFAPPGSPYAGEERVAAALEALARREGLETARQKVAPGRYNLIVRLAPRRVRSTHRVILAPHLDTVGGPELPGRLFTPRLKGGRLFGRGACDTKGSVAAMFTALLAVARSNRRPDQTELLFLGLADEECHQAGSRAFARSQGGADLAIVGEPTGLRVITAHKGDLWLRLETRGRAAHGARPELGRNAVHEMAGIVNVLETEYAQWIGRRRHGLLGRPTVNVGAIHGGRQPNIVPDHCEALVDRRTLPGERDAAVIGELRGFLRARGFRPRVVDTKAVPSSPLETDPAHPLVRQLMSANGQRRPQGVEFFSDGGVLGAGGIPSVLFGPGNIAQAHTEEEWIDLGQLDEAREVLVRFLAGLP